MSCTCLQWSVRGSVQLAARWFAPMLCAAVLLTQGVANAQQKFLTPILSQAVRNNWLRFDLAAGRIVIAGGQVGNINTNTSSNGQSESFSILMENGQPTARYERTAGDSKFSVHASGSNCLKIVRATPDEPRMEFNQEPGRPLALILGEKDEQKEYRGATVWHLFLSEPEVCAKSLLPALDLIRPEWKLGSLATAVEKDLLRRASGVEDHRRKQWAEWVANLGSDQFARRQEADRLLRAAGPAALSYLEQLNPKELDAEQEYRIRRITDSLSVKIGGTSAERISAWLAGDASIWLVFLDRPDLATREAAAKELSQIIGTPIAFDPAAAPNIRSRQLEKLRLLLEGKESRGKMMDAAPQRVGSR